MLKARPIAAAFSIPTGMRVVYDVVVVINGRLDFGTWERIFQGQAERLALMSIKHAHRRTPVAMADINTLAQLPFNLDVAFRYLKSIRPSKSLALIEQKPGDYNWTTIRSVV